MNFDTIFENAMKLYEAEQPKIDPKTGKPALQQPSGIQPPSGTPPVAGTQPETPDTTQSIPAIAQPNIAAAKAGAAPAQPPQPQPPQPQPPQPQPPATQQPAAQIELSPEQSKMNAQQIMQSLAQAAGPQGKQVIQQMLAQLQQPK